MKKPAIVLSGVVAGVVLLALVLLLAVLLPKLHDDQKSLPKSLPGGFTAVDDKGTWTNMSKDVEAQFEQAGTTGKQLQTQLEAMHTAGDKVISKITTADYQSRLYVDSKFQSLYAVQVVSGTKAAFLPDLFTATSMQVQKIGDATCEVTTDQSSGATSSECQVAKDTQIVNVSASTDAKLVARVADSVVAALS